MTADRSPKACPTCGPTGTESHPRRTGVTRCANCKEWLTSVTADRSPGATADAAAVAGSGHLTDADRATLLTPCECGHDFNHHGDPADCWTCPELEPARECDVTGSDLMARHIAAIKAAAVNEALDAARWEVHALRFAKEEGVLRGPDNFYNGVITSEAVLRNRAARRT